MSVAVPQLFQVYVAAASKALGIPEDVVAAQIQLESDWNPHANSPAGAEGIAQFEPATFATYGPKGGSPYDVSDAFSAYTAYMGDLLKQEHGNVRNALAAYNAGPGNLAAGYGYADSILSTANQSSSLLSQVESAAGGALGVLTGGASSTLGGLLSFPTDIVNFFSSATDDLGKTADFFGAFFQPSTYVRIGSGVAGFVAIIAGLVCLGLAAND